MNWIEIKNKHPKAFAKLLWYYEGIPYEIRGTEYDGQWGDKTHDFGHYYDNGVHHHVPMWNSFILRDLYDFFDSLNIHVSVWIGNYSQASFYYTGDVVIEDVGSVLSGLRIDLARRTTRGTSEHYLFEIAFETLEDILNT